MPAASSTRADGGPGARSGAALAAAIFALSALGSAWAQAPAEVRSALIDAPQLMRDLQVLSADDMEGRLVGTPGGARARAYIVDRFRASGLLPFGSGFEQRFTFRAARGGQATDVEGVNVVGRVDGTRHPRRYLVLTAHYDHVGVRSGQIFNGANDNASGTAALFALAKYFRVARPENTIIFAALDGEESGLRGARAFVTSPPVEPGALAINLNMDMIGRDRDNVLYVAGTRAQPYLKPFIERIAAKAPVTLVMGHDDPAQREDWTSQSDHREFCDAKIPCLYFGVEDFDQLHRATDDYETMTHAFYVRAVETMVLAVREFDTNLDAMLKARGAKEPRLP